MAVRIGFAYNLKPSLPAPASGASVSDSVAPIPAVSSRRSGRALRPDLPQPDLYAEWDEPETVDAVERALSP